MTPGVSSSLRRGGARASAHSNGPGIREELIEALAEALVADIEQCPTVPTSAPVMTGQTPTARAPLLGRA
jgi:hypothetical protein